MKLFVYEYITSGALVAEDFPPSLAHEGDAMLKALLHDLNDIGSLELHLMRDKRLEAIPANAHCHWVNNDVEYQNLWQQTIHHCDYTIVIAPETDNILLELSREIPSSKYFGCTPNAIETCTNKLITSLKLQQHGIATPNTLLAADWLAKQPDNDELIIKPIDGAGCLDTHHFSHHAARDYLSQLTGQQLEKLIVQPFISGMPASISVFIDHEIHILSINEQFISIHQSQLIFDDCKITQRVQSLLSPETATQITKQISTAIDGLQGFVGIDLILSDNEVVIVEVNPRLTTAYLDLQNHLNFNPALFLTKAITHT